VSCVSRTCSSSSRAMGNIRPHVLHDCGWSSPAQHGSSREWVSKQARDIARTRTRTQVPTTTYVAVGVVVVTLVGERGHEPPVAPRDLALELRHRLLCQGAGVDNIVVCVRACVRACKS
jgi:hypothetical protein